jgi:sporulation protein YlmC with PRC-barrel domain
MLKQSQLLSADKIKGYRVTNAAGENLAKIEDLVIDAEHACVAYAVLSVGGRFFPTPWEALQPSPSDEDKFIYTIDKGMLKNAPGFDKGDRDQWSKLVDRDHVARIYQYYGYQPYWEEREPVRASSSLEEHEREHHSEPSRTS